MSSRLPLPGDLIDGRYRVQRRLGAGSMGAVYEARHHVTGRRFALKWLLPELTRVRGAVERFIREAQIGAQFEHPNLVEVYDIGQDAGSVYIVMELLEGETLAERLTRVGRLTPSAACELLCPCMEALAVAHEAGVIHRDLKPANIFVCKAGSLGPEHARVLDFGISKLERGSQLERQQWAMTTPGMVLGTPEYMAPEQMRGEDVDARADVYAFGVILYEALSGEPPFKAESFADLVAKVLTETPRSLDRLAELPKGLAEIVTKAIARDPADRFESLAALLKALAPFRTGRAEPAADVTEHVVTRAEVPRPPRKSNAGSIAAFMAAVTFVVAGTWATKAPVERAPETSEVLDLANQEPQEAPIEPEPTMTVRELEAVADARLATKAPQEPERRATPPRRTTPSAPAKTERAQPAQERPITVQRLSNGLIDPFATR